MSRGGDAYAATNRPRRAIYNLGAAYYGQGLRDRMQEVHAQLSKVNPTLAGQFATRYVKP